MIYQQKTVLSIKYEYLFKNKYCKQHEGIWDFPIF